MTESLEAAYEALIPEFLALPADPRAAVDAYYRERLYPLAQERMRRHACAPVEVLFLTAGGQPWSIALSLLATPAKHVVFLCTERSHREAEEAVRLAGLSSDIDRQYPRVDQANPVPVYTKILEAYRTYGEPRDIAVDITSGTKSMTAAASSAAMVLGARQRYIGSEQLRPGHFGREKIYELEHPLKIMGDLERREAERHFNELTFDRAADLFDTLHEQGAPDFLYPERAAIARAYGDWDALRFAEAGSRLGTVLARVRNHRGIDPLKARQGELAAQQARLVELANAPSTAVFLRFLVSYARRREAQGLLDAAALVHYRSIEETVQARLREAHGVDASGATEEAYANAAERAGVKDLLAEHNRIAGKPERALSALPTKVSLMTGWTLLRALKDQLTEGVNTERLRGRVDRRNRSVFAHGRATLAREDYDRLVEVAEEIRARYASLAGIELPKPDLEFDFINFA